MYIIIEIALNFISVLGDTSVPIYFITIVLCIIVLYICVSSFLGRDVPSITYVLLFGLLPYRFLKPIYFSQTQTTDISLGFVIIFLLFLFLIWRFIDKVVPYVFNTYLGQIFLAFSLSVFDKVGGFIEDVMEDLFVLFLTSFWIIMATVLLLIRCENLYYPYFLFLLALQPYLWTKSFCLHFLKEEVADSCREDLALKNPSNFT